MKVLVFLLALFAGGALASCSCGEMDLGGGEEDGGDVDVIDGDAADPGDAGEFSWTPPIGNLGSPGWRDSTEPWCPGVGQVPFSFDVWSYDGGVYVLVADTVTTDRTFDLNHIYFNNGTGWSLAYEQEARDNPNYFFNIMGLTPTKLLAWGSISMSGPLAYIEGGTATYEDVDVIDVFVVNETLAYALGPWVMKYNGEGWTPIYAELPWPVNHLWADEEDVFVAGSDGAVISLVDGEWVIHESGTYQYIESIWGFSGSDVWIGDSRAELRHYDGETWSRIDWPDQSGSLPSPIGGMWGTDDVLFFHNSMQLTRYQGGEFTVLGTIEDRQSSYIKAIWGNSPTEVFLAVTDRDHESADCGPEYLLWWDGTEFHWF